jgi:hypothetical protein
MGEEAPGIFSIMRIKRIPAEWVQIIFSVIDEERCFSIPRWRSDDDRR